MNVNATIWMLPKSSSLFTLYLLYDCIQFKYSILGNIVWCFNVFFCFLFRKYTILIAFRIVQGVFKFEIIYSLTVKLCFEWKVLYTTAQVVWVAQYFRTSYNSIASGTVVFTKNTFQTRNVYYMFTNFILYFDYQEGTYIESMRSACAIYEVGK